MNTKIYNMSYNTLAPNPNSIRDYRDNLNLYIYTL